MSKNSNPRKGSYVYDVILVIILLILAVVAVIPFYSMLVSSTWDNGTLSSTFALYPGPYFMDNYNRMMLQSNIWRGMLNSFIIAASITTLASYFGALTAYGFSKFRFKANKALFAVLLGTMMIPGQLGLIGYFNLMNTMGLLDQYAALIIPAMASAIAVFWNKQYMDAFVPDTLIEAARIDGCREITIFHKIIFPMVIPAVATQGIFTFVGAWNQFIQPLTLLFSQEKFPLTVLVSQMQGLYGQDYGVTYTGITLSILPIFIIFILFSRRILDNVAAGAVKG